MAAATDDGTTLLAKKIGAIALLVFGLIAVASGFGYNSIPLIVVGVLLLIGAGVLFALKVVRRNEPPN